MGMIKFPSSCSSPKAWYDISVNNVAEKSNSAFYVDTIIYTRRNNNTELTDLIKQSETKIPEQIPDHDIIHTMHDYCCKWKIPQGDF